MEARLAVAASEGNRAGADHNLSRAFIGLGEHDEADSAACKSIAADPEGPHGYYLRAFVFRMKGDLKAAEEAIRSALARSNDYALYHEELAAILLKGDRWAEALTAIDLGLKHDAESVSLLQKRVRALLALGRVLEAREIAAQALSLDPLNSLTHQHVGTIEGTLTNLAGAEAHQRRAIRLNPKSDEAKEQLVGVLYSRPALFRWLVKVPEKREQFKRECAAALILAIFVFTLGDWGGRLYFYPFIPFWVIFWERLAKFLYFPCCTLWLYRKREDRALFPRMQVAGAFVSAALIASGVILQLAAPVVNLVWPGILGAVAFLLVIPTTLMFQFKFTPVWALWRFVGKLIIAACLPLVVLRPGSPALAVILLGISSFYVYHSGRGGIALPKWKEKGLTR